MPHLCGSRHHLFAFTVEKSALDLLAFVASATVILIAFTSIFHFTLGTYLPEFATLSYAFFTVILGLSSVWEPSHWYNSDPVTAVILLFGFTTTITWLLATMVIAIISEAFVAAKADIALQLQQKVDEKLRKSHEITSWIYDVGGAGGATASQAPSTPCTTPPTSEKTIWRSKLQTSVQTLAITGMLSKSGSGRNLWNQPLLRGSRHSRNDPESTADACAEADSSDKVSGEEEGSASIELAETAEKLSAKRLVEAGTGGAREERGA